MKRGPQFMTPWLKRIARSVTVVAGALVSTGCDLLELGPEIRYRITVVIDTPVGPRSGSGVWELKLRPGNMDQAFNSRFRGEAIPVDLPDGKTVFALLELRGANNNPTCCGGMIPEYALPRHLPGGRFPSELRGSRIPQLEYLKQQVRKQVKLNCKTHKNGSECPLLVTFDDPKTPSSVHALEPEDFSTSLGPGYQLSGIFLKIVNDPPTKNQLEDRIPWEREIGKSHYLDGKVVSGYSSLANSLSMISFKRWDK